MIARARVCARVRACARVCARDSPTRAQRAGTSEASSPFFFIWASSEEIYGKEVSEQFRSNLGGWR